VLLVIANLRRAFMNIAAGTPFPGEHPLHPYRRWAILGFSAVELLISPHVRLHEDNDDDRRPARRVSAGFVLAIDFPWHDRVRSCGRRPRGDLQGRADLQDDQALTV